MMKKITNWLIYGLLTIAGLSACSDDKWDNHYAEQQITVASSDLNIEVVDAEIISYLKSRDEFSAAFALYEQNGLPEMMKERNQQYTLLICDNDAMATRQIEDVAFFINSSICNVPMSPTSLTDGTTLTMWCGKYLKVAVKEEPAATKATGNEEEQQPEEGEATPGETVINTYIADVKVLKCIKTTNGYIYVMKEPVIALKSLYETFNDLDDAKYSMFKNLVRSYEINEFDKAASEPIGIDKTGNTIYDSVFTVRNSYLDWYTSRFTGIKGSTLKWDMRSEAFNSTMLIPSDEVMKECIDNACRYQKEMLGWEVTSRDSAKFREWILRACFYSGELTPEQLSGGENISSITGYHERHQDWYQALDAALWNPNIQEVDVANPVKMSNGVAYYINKMKIPNYYVIWRIKNLAWWTYAACDDQQKQEYYKFVNIRECILSVDYTFGGWDELTPEVGPGVIRMQLAYDTVFNADGSVASKTERINKETSAEWTTLNLSSDHTSVSVQRVPPGEYKLHMGWVANKQTWTVTVYAAYEGDELVQVNESPIASANSHYDRTASGWGKYQYDYNTNYYNQFLEEGKKKAGNYNCNGLLVGTINLSGTESKPMRIKQVSYNINDKSKPMYLFHWCLCPTENNY